METQDLAPPARAGKVTTENHRPGDGETDVAHLRDLIDGIDAVVYEVDSHGWVHFVNRRAVELFGYPQERWLSQPSFWHAITYHDDRPKVRAHFYQCVRYSQAQAPGVSHRCRRWAHHLGRESLRASRDTLHGTRLLRGVMWKIHPGRKAGEPLSLARQQLTEQLADMAEPAQSESAPLVNGRPGTAPRGNLDGNGLDPGCGHGNGTRLRPSAPRSSDRRQHWGSEGISGALRPRAAKRCRVRPGNRARQLADY